MLLLSSIVPSSLGYAGTIISLCIVLSLEPSISVGSDFRLYLSWNIIFTSLLIILALLSSSEF